jgi:membrane protein YqaA with SNARE-associated domain
MNSVFASAAWLFGYAFLSNVALAVLPHEPVVIWYGARHGVWPTALVATAGTVLAALLDHRLLAPVIERAAARRAGIPDLKPGLGASLPERVFRRFPFAVITLSGLTPLPFFPFKALAFATGYPPGKYAAAVAARSLPRYALLAWLGASVRLPVWLYVALFTLLLVPSLRIVLWPPSTRAAS